MSGLGSRLSRFLWISPKITSSSKRNFSFSSTRLSAEVAKTSKGKPVDPAMIAAIAADAAKAKECRGEIPPPPVSLVKKLKKIKQKFKKI